MKMTRGEAAPTSSLVDIGDGLQVPSEIVAAAEDVNGYTVDLVATYSAESGRYETRELTVRRGDGAEVTGEGLRKVPVARILRNAVVLTLEPSFTTVVKELDRDQQVVTIDDRDNMRFRAVARIYRLALILGESPTQAVARDLNVPRSTAGRWVTRARDRGLLTVQDPRAGRSI